MAVDVGLTVDVAGTVRVTADSFTTSVTSVTEK